MMPYSCFAEIIEHRKLADGFRRLVVEAPEIAHAAVPGQFVHVLCGNSTDPLLRRPFSIQDADEGRVSVVYEVRGRGTALLSHKISGERLDILGPLGQGFRLPESPDQPVVLVAGGVGVPPIHFLARRLAETMPGVQVTALIGSATADKLICADEVSGTGCECRLATDDGSTGHCGFVTDLLNEFLTNSARDCRKTINRACPPSVPGRASPSPLAGEGRRSRAESRGRGEGCTSKPPEAASPNLQPPTSKVYACGPMPMLAAVARISREHGAKCQVSVEAKMACGVGACMSCVIKVRAGDSFKYVRSCKEGPVFDADEVIWE